MRKSKKGKLYLGTCGWSYKDWGDGVFYPPDLKQSKWLEYYCKQFKTIEINNTFYHLPPKETFASWGKTASEDFTFSVKVNRFITHIKKLQSPEVILKGFLENISGLGKKLGPILFQFPPFWGISIERLKELFEYLKKQKIIPNIQTAFEFRDKTWLDNETTELLKENNASLSLADGTELEVSDPIPTGFIYMKRHGAKSMSDFCYNDEALKSDSEKIRKWLAEGRNVYVYFNNDVKGFAVKNAKTLLELVSDSSK